MLQSRIQNSMRKKAVSQKEKILIAGAGGYIGSVMTKYLLEKDYTVIALDRFFFGEETLGDCTQHKNLIILKEDTRFFDKTILRDVNIVIDLSGLSNDPSAELNSSLTKSINIDGCIRLAELSKQMNVERYIFASSCSVYGEGKGVMLTEKSELNPITLYAKAKIVVEQKLLNLASDDFAVTITRNATCFGVSPRMRFDLAINTMTLSAYKNNIIHVNGGGKQWRPFIHILDVVKAFERVLLTPRHIINKQIFNIGSNEQNYQLFELAKKIQYLFPECKLKIQANSFESRNYKVNFDKAAKILEFSPKITVAEGAQEIKTALEKMAIATDIKTITVNFYKYLIEADIILQKIKYNNVLFL